MENFLSHVVGTTLGGRDLIFISMGGKYIRSPMYDRVEGLYLHTSDITVEGILYLPAY